MPLRQIKFGTLAWKRCLIADYLRESKPRPYVAGIQDSMILALAIIIHGATTSCCGLQFRGFSNFYLFRKSASASRFILKIILNILYLVSHTIQEI